MTELKPELRKAVALFYDGSGAPQVTAKGMDEEAAQIVALAQEHNIPLCDNPALVELLSHIELGEHVPETLYVAVAHILAFAYSLRYPTPTDPLGKPAPFQ